MEITPLGGTGMRVSRMCLGAMMFGAMGNRDHDDCVRIVHRALDAGINFIDTADVYSRGESEEVVAKAVHGRRDELVIATKFFAPMSGDPNHQGGSRRWIVREVENSLRRLGTDYIDLYQVHRFDDATDPEETLWALTDLVQQGKIRAFGSSMFPPDRIVECQALAERRGLLRYRCEQPWYSIFSREIERYVLPICLRYGMGAIVWSPLDGGWLTGRYRTPEDFGSDARPVRMAQMRGGSFDPATALNARKLALVGELDGIAKDAGVPLSQLAIAFTLEHPGVTATILGPRTMEQLDDVLPAADVRLAPEILDRIDKLIPPGTNVNPIDVTSRPAGLAKAARRRAH